ncbi:pimeloyl-ACP methyl ester carboxylesterase [Actinoplanes tereljensis]|uniref:Alpha/beta hydrolase n=1 Tax=Paractinoplanes tereljensis TaxID=571912 RepID=A0A919NSN8_9ACTN|nr:alpha/beta hydrolase [Actinoplanes tereljensis]GIF23993.1 alpha/beta hydrolase [Actinoplanes tereljensis]
MALDLGYRQAGDPAGAPVLLLHGSGSNASTWDRFTPRLTEAGFRTIAADLRGHGTSPRPGDYALTSIRDDVLALLETLDLRNAIVIGHSVGGHAALAAALVAPDRIAGLVLEDLAAPPQQPGSVSLRGINPLQVLAAIAGIATVRRDYDLRAVGSILRQLTRPDPLWWEQLSEVRQPTLILSGGPTSCIPPKRLAEATAAIPGARLTTIPVGHRVHSLAPDRFATEVLTFLAQADDLVTSQGSAVPQ